MRVVVALAALAAIALLRAAASLLRRAGRR